MLISREFPSCVASVLWKIYCLENNFFLSDMAVFFPPAGGGRHDGRLPRVDISLWVTTWKFGNLKKLFFYQFFWETVFTRRRRHWPVEDVVRHELGASSDREEVGEGQGGRPDERWGLCGAMKTVEFPLNIRSYFVKNLSSFLNMQKRRGRIFFFTVQ